MMSINYSAIRGFNYLPSYASNLQLLWTHYDDAVWDREVGWSKRFGSNMLRLWLDWHAYIAMEDEFFEVLDSALAELAKHNIQAMLVLFNRWHNSRWPMGGVGDRDLIKGAYEFSQFAPYVQGLLQRFGSDERVAIWDLCNEPQAPHLETQINFLEYLWLARVANWVRQDSDIPITIGTEMGDNVRIFAPLVDVISIHPYTRVRGDIEQVCADHVAMAADFGKPLICTETGTGSFDDVERGEHVRLDVETFRRYEIGWLLCHLMEGRFTTASQARADHNALHPGQGLLPFMLKDGRTRPGHEWLEVES